MENKNKKVLVLFGSARQNGFTRKMLNYFLSFIEGEIVIIDSYKEKNVHPCIDCRYCWYKRGCSIKDRMEDIYEMIETFDTIIIASPMYFHSIPGPLKTIIDRLQVYWACHMRKDKNEVKRKQGAIIFVGGAKFFLKQFDAGKQLGLSLLDDLNCNCQGIITFSDSDHQLLDETIFTDLKNLALKLNKEVDINE